MSTQRGEFILNTYLPTYPRSHQRTSRRLQEVPETPQHTQKSPLEAPDDLQGGLLGSYVASRKLPRTPLSSLGISMVIWGLLEASRDHFKGAR